MLNEIELLNHGSGFIVIGFESSTDVNDKASFNSDKGREFLGITTKDLNQILKTIPDSGTPEEEEILEVPTLTQLILRKLSGSE